MLFNIIMIVMTTMIWVSSGLFVAFLMRTVDEKGPRSSGYYWIKNENIYSVIFLIVLAYYLQ